MRMTPNKQITGSKVFFHIIAFIIVTIWGSTLISSKVLLQDGMREDEIFFARMVIAYIAILFISPKKLWADSWQDELWMVGLGLTGGSMYFISENYALQYTLANNVSFIVAASPLITTLLALAFTKGMKATKSLIFGSVLALVGVAFVIFFGKGSCGKVEFNLLGDLLAVVSSFCFGLYCLMLKKFSNRYDPVFITRKVFAYGLLTTLPIFIFMPWQFEFSRFWEPTILFNLLFLGIVASFACFLLWSVATKKLGAVLTANYIYLSPVATIVVSWLVLDERMTFMGWVGSALILMGVILANENCKES